MGHVVFANGPRQGERVALAARTTIGRSPSCVVRLAGAPVSRLHAEILDTDEGYVLHDRSRNGIFVNGAEVKSRRLANGDEISVGSEVLRFEDDARDEEMTDPGGESYVLYTDTDGGSSSIASSLDARGFSLSDSWSLPGGDVPEALHRKLMVVYEVSTAIATILNTDELLARLAELVVEVLGGDRCSVLLWDSRREALAPASSRQRPGRKEPFALSKTILYRVFNEGQAVLARDVPADRRLAAIRSGKLDRVKSMMCVPLICGDLKIGVIYVDTASEEAAYRQEDLILLTAIAGQAAVALFNAQRFTRSQEENRSLKERLAGENRLVGNSRALRALMEQVSRVAPTDATVLLRGETGTGKELVAQAIHDGSSRRTGPFVAFNCAAVTESLLESELFGHERGAFTGAHREKPGKFELAHRGTLFLDEIGDVSLEMQTKLLRALEERRFERVGGTRSLDVDVRLVAATNRNLEQAVLDGQFRRDLYYRLSVVPLHLPPLVEREGDVEMLLHYYLDYFSRKCGRLFKGFSDAALHLLIAHDWPGNVRELRNTVERMVVLAEGPYIEERDLPSEIARRDDGFRDMLAAEVFSLPELVARAEKNAILRALDRAGGKKVEAARLLEISRPTLDKKLREYQIDE
ncbi:MAG: sigma 54-interacting transcriptional regulator [Planctomycetes bacterium]|nr:sigma 54-interacting transcriptional regulator [Planctomycetota bacterium]